jgi:hypothetical protein
VKKTAVCLLGCNVKSEWLNFLNSFENYDTYVMLDDPLPFYLQQIQKEFPKVKILFANDNDCKDAGFTNMNFLMSKQVTSWERAVYHFSRVNTTYDNIWFLEDDIFINDENVLVNIDKKYPETDLLTSTCTTVQDPSTDGWHWHRIKIEFPPPHCRVMVCGVRVSSKLLSDISDYAIEHKTLFFLESLFATICLRNPNLTHIMPDEMNTIEYRYHWHTGNVYEKRNNIIHPIKEMADQIAFRKYIKSLN